MKVVVAGVNERGRSYVETTRELSGEEPPVFVWDEPDLGNLLELIDRVDPDAFSPEIAPAPGAFKWVYQVRPPQAEQTERPHYAMHASRTIDFDFVITGRHQCVLDEEVVELEAGDFIILKAASHEWRNPGEVPSAILFMLYTPPGH